LHPSLVDVGKTLVHHTLEDLFTNGRRVGTGLVMVEALETWQPRGETRVDLQEVEDATAALAR